MADNETLLAAALEVDDPRFVAAIDLIRRTGMMQFQVRQSDDPAPTVWVAVAIYEPATKWETATGHTPLEAVFRLCSQLLDGGTCTHCSRATGFTEDMDEMPVDHLVCWYQWDPELSTFRRGCEGDRG